MIDLYLLITLGTIGTFCCIAGTVTMLLTVGGSLAYMFNDYMDYEADNKALHRKVLKRAWIISPIFVFFGLFIPSKKELYTIYGVGTTIDYLKENPTAQQLPDKCIKALDVWLNEQIEEK